MPRPATRFAAGALVLALPLAAAAGCGAEKKRTIRAEFASAQTNFEQSRAASMTLRLEDSQDNGRKLMAQQGDTADALADAFLGGSITYVVDPVGARTLKDVSFAPGATSADLERRLEEVNIAVVLRDDKAALGEIRLVEGTLYVQVNLKEIGRLAKAGGVEDFDAQLDEAVTSADPTFAQGLADLRAGKWIRLPLADYLDQFKDLAESFGQSFGAPSPPAADSFDAAGLGRQLYDGVKPFVTVTDANDSSTDRVLDVKVQARPAIKAALKILAAAEDLPFPNVFKDIDPAEVDDTIAEGTADGTVTLRSGHLSQVTVDVESLRLLATDPGSDSLAGTAVVLELDDSADEVKAPDNVSDFDLGAAVEDLLQGVGEGFADTYGG